MAKFILFPEEASTEPPVRITLEETLNGFLLQAKTPGGQRQNLILFEQKPNEAATILVKRLFDEDLCAVLRVPVGHRVAVTFERAKGEEE